MSNPLVVERQDSTQGFTGVPILESVDETKKAIESGDWAAGVLGAAGTALDAVGMAMDPFGAILAAGVGWLMEHVGPLSDALDALTGDPDEIKAHAQTWKNVSDELASIGTEMTTLVKNDTAGWTGAAGDAYRARSEDTAALLAAAQSAADGASNGVGTAGEVVGAVRTLVRDIIAELVGHLVSWALQVLATLGIAMAWVVPQVIAEVAKVASRIADITMKLIKAMKALTPLLKKLGGSFGEASAALKKIKANDAAAPPPVRTPPPGKGPENDAPRGGSDGPGGNGPAQTNSTGADSNTPPPKTNQGPSPSPGDKPGTEGPTNAGNPPAGGGSRGGGSGPGTRDRSGGGIRDNNRNPKENSTPTCNNPQGGDPIDMSTGRMMLTQTDVAVPGTLPLMLSRTHLSTYRCGFRYGETWASTVDQRLEFDDLGVSFAVEDGTILAYPVPGPHDEVLPLEGPEWPLRQQSGGGYTITQPDHGRVLFFASDGNGRVQLKAIFSDEDTFIQFRHDTNGVLTEIRHSGGHRIDVETTAGLITAYTMVTEDARIELVRYRYDENDRLIEIIDSSGRPLRFEYDRRGRIVRWLDRNDMWYRYVYDDLDRCVRGEGIDGFLSATFEYDRENRVNKVTNSLGHTTTFHLNENFQLVREVDPLGNATEYEWDHRDRLLSRTDPLGRVTRYHHDDQGRLVAVAMPDGSQERAEYDARGRLIARIGRDGSVRRRVYDDADRIVAEVDPLGAVTQYEYPGNRLSCSVVTDQSGSRTYIERDAMGRPLSVTDPLGATTRFSYDGLGHAITRRDPVGGGSRFEWTVEGKQVQEQRPDGTMRRRVHDDEGNMREEIDPKGAVTRKEYGPFDLPTAEIAEDGSRVEFGYDTELRLTTVTNQRGLVWRYTYDAVGNLTQENDFNGRVLRYAYDAAGQLIERVNGVGQSIRFTLNVMGQVVAERADGVVTTFDYDAAGRLSRARNADVELSFQYDAAGRVVAETVNGRTVSSAYDILGRRTRRRTPSGAESVWEYDANGRPVTLRTAEHMVRFAYDAAGREVGRQFGSNLRLTHTWDANDRLSSQSVTSGREFKDPATGRPIHQPRLIQRRGYRYREDGFVNAIVDQLTGARELDLDASGRVTGVYGAGATEQYAYDPAGRIVNATTGGHEYSGSLVRRAGSVSYQYDAQGRVILRAKQRVGREPDVWRYEWDAEDRLIGVITPDGHRWRYQYDPLGRRIAKQHFDTGRDAVVERVDFTWDGPVLAEQHHTSGRTVTWDCEFDGFRPLIQRERTRLANATQQSVDERFYAIVNDLVGTPAELVDLDGNLAGHFRASLWGEPTAQGGHASTPLRFPGQYIDPETELHYNFYRYYDPASGRYISNDPLGLAPGPDPYSYPANPTYWADPLGLGKCSDPRGSIKKPDYGPGWENRPNKPVTVYRVEGPPKLDENGNVVKGKEGNQRLNIDTNGNVSIPDKKKALYLNFGDNNRAAEYLEKRNNQSFEGIQLKSFELPKQYVDDIRNSAVPELEASATKAEGRPLMSDVTKTNDSFGIRKPNIGNLENNILPGSGKVTEPDDFLKQNRK